MKDNIRDFFQLIKNKEIEIYNEFSLQHELGIYLRSKFPKLKIQFERNVAFFNLDKEKYYKKEIDLVMFQDEYRSYVMELKFPRNGQVPESMFGFCKDIAFLEQLVNSENGFKVAYFIAVVDHHTFYSEELINTNPIYGLFRNGHEITGEIQKPTGKKDSTVKIRGSYIAEWQHIFDVPKPTKYCEIKIENTL